MPQPMYCDVADCGLPANVLSTILDNGQATAYCWPHYLDVITLQVDQFRDEERRQAEEQSEEQAETQDGEQAEAPEAPTAPVEAPTAPVAPPETPDGTEIPAETEKAPTASRERRRAAPELAPV